MVKIEWGMNALHLYEPGDVNQVLKDAGINATASADMFFVSHLIFENNEDATAFILSGDGDRIIEYLNDIAWQKLLADIDNILDITGLRDDDK